MTDERERRAVTTLIASFDQPEDARAAMVEAELAGLDAEAMHLRDTAPQTPVSIERSGELAALDDVAKRSFVGGAIGGLALAVVSVIVVLIIHPDRLGVALVIAALGGAIVGSVLGGFWTGAARLPANPEALDTYTIDPADDRPVVVEFRLADGKPASDEIERLCRKHGAIDLDRRTA